MKNVNILKYVAIGLSFVFLVTGALMAIEIWDQKQGGFSKTEDFQNEISFEGKEYQLKNNLETFLVLGLDTFEGADDGQTYKQADFLMLFVFDNENKEFTALQINRDTMAKVHRLDIAGNTIGTEIKQIALAYNYGYDNSEKVNCRNTADAVSDLLGGMKVNHYMSFTMDAVTIMNDLVNGVEVTVLDDFTGIDLSLIKGEKVTLRGEQALLYVRTRKGLDDSSNAARMKRQQQYINALYEKVDAALKADDGFALEMIDAIDDHVVYDSSDQRMKELTQKINEYTFMGIKNIDGETKVTEYVEFYPDEASIRRLVMEMFYTTKE
jgi:LCP family protein required for cell wall assembly